MTDVTTRAGTATAVETAGDRTTGAPPRDPAPARGLAAAFVAVHQSLQAEGDVGAALRSVVDLAVRWVPGCDWAAVTTWSRGRPHDLAASSEVALTVDAVQRRLEEGPCLAATRDEDTVRVRDLATEPRWPRFRRAALASTRVRGVLAFHLLDEPRRTVLDLYGADGGRLDDEGFEVASLFAAHARALLLHAASADKAAQLTNALTSSRHIGAAVGIVMAAHKVTADAAFDLLRVCSQNSNRKLRDVADHVTRTGALPDAADHPPSA